MLGHRARSSSPMHATPPKGTATPTHPQPHPRESPMLDHPTGGGGMPLPQGGPGSSAGTMHEPAMPLGRALRPKVGAPKMGPARGNKGFGY